MRKTKFRLWDKENNKMIYADQDGYAYEDSEENLFIGLDGEIYYLGNDGGCSDPECCGGRNYYMEKIEREIILLQFTGLKDKNGREIYEGDIVKRGTTISDIVWKNVGFRLRKGNCISDVVKPIEVIGNIYENSELLENKKE